MVYCLTGYECRLDACEIEKGQDRHPKKIQKVPKKVFEKYKVSLVRTKEQFLENYDFKIEREILDLVQNQHHRSQQSSGGSG